MPMFLVSNEGSGSAILLVGSLSPTIYQNFKKTGYQLRNIMSFAFKS